MNVIKKSVLRAVAFIAVLCAATYLLLPSSSNTSNTTAAEIVTADTGVKVKAVYRFALGPDDLLLESIQELIRKHNIADGAVLSGIGSLKICRYHYPETFEFPPVSKSVTLNEPLELLSLQGIIADGIPHIHFSASNPEKAFGGHLEEGSKVLYLAEIAVAEFDGPAFTRRPSEYGIQMLQQK